MVKIEEIERPKQKQPSTNTKSSWYHHDTTAEAPSLIPILPPPKWKRNVTLKDTDPTPVKPAVDDKDDESSSPQSCQICHSHMARYTCPRCDVPYCSISCYKNHNNGDANGSNSCTEAFYQDRVTSVLDLEAKEGSKSMEEIIVRSRQCDLEEGFLPNHEDGESGMESVNYSEEELWKLAEALERTDLLDDDAALAKLMTPELRQAFERDIQRGHLNGILESWHPWWRPDLTGSTINTETTLNSNLYADDDGENITHKARRTKQTLDDKLLALPSLQSLVGSKASLAATNSSSIIQFNLVELLYNICLTLRLYYGVDNALASSQDAVFTLISSSDVLRQDARFTSLEEVLTTCTASSTKNAFSTKCSIAGGCNTHWTILAEDVALLLDGNGEGTDNQHRCRRRYVARALFEAIDICKSATKSAKKQNTHKRSNIGKIKDDDGDKDVTDVKELRKIRKKLEFYVSWSQEVELEGKIATEIRSWIQDWELKKNDETDDRLETLRLPTNADTNNKDRPRIEQVQESNGDAFLLTERSSRRIA